MKKIYTLLMILLPLFVGIGYGVLLIQYFAGYQITTNPYWAAVFAVAGIATGVRNIWVLLE